MHDISSTSDTGIQNPFPAGKPGWVKVAAILAMAIGLAVLCGWAWAQGEANKGATSFFTLPRVED